MDFTRGGQGHDGTLEKHSELGLISDNLRTLEEENNWQIFSSLFEKGGKNMLRICPVFQYRKVVRTRMRKKNVRNMSSFLVQKSCKDSNERKEKCLEDVEFSSTEKM